MTTFYAPRLNLPPVTENKTLSTVNIVTTPSTGINLGNFKDATAWEYRVDRWTKFVGSGTENWPKNVLHNTKVGVIGGDPNSLGTWDPANLYTRALERLNAKARETTDWSETLAEASQLRRMGNLADSAIDLAKSLRRNPIKGLAGGYLQFKLGWQPLLSGIYDTATMVLNYDRDVGLIRLRGGATQPIDSTNLVTNTNMWTNAKAIKQTVYGKQGVRLEVVISTDKPPSLSDFTTLNPLLLGWNLIPYSFVVDWFYSVGGYLENLETAYLLAPRFKSGFRTDLFAYDLIERIEEHVCPNNTNLKIIQARAHRHYVHFKRTKLTSWPLPNKPHLKVDLGSGKLLTAAALLGTLLKS